jgi:diguanylate cyclase (GGDEF)-like protein
LELPSASIVYFWLRLALSGGAGVAAIAVFWSAWRAQREGRPWQWPATWGFVLCAATALSVYDAIDNELLRADDPVTLASWLWFILFDLPMPILVLLLVLAWGARDRALAELSMLSVTDQLTGVLNRRGFFERAAAAIAQSRRTALPTALIMFDIDHFKAVNDSYGHTVGDEVLQLLSRTLSSGIGPGDILARIGGEEFVVFLHDSSGDTAAAIADRLRVAIRAGVRHPAGSSKVLTVSGGVAVLKGELEPEASLTIALKAADEALYVAKREGRDRIIAAPVCLQPTLSTRWSSSGAPVL